MVRSPPKTPREERFLTKVVILARFLTKVMKRAKVTILAALRKRLFPEVVFWPGSAWDSWSTNSETGDLGVTFLPQSWIPSVNALGYRAK